MSLRPGPVSDQNDQIDGTPENTDVLRQTDPVREAARKIGDSAIVLHGIGRPAIAVRVDVRQEIVVHPAGFPGNDHSEIARRDHVRLASDRQVPVPGVSGLVPVEIDGRVNGVLKSVARHVIGENAVNVETVTVLHVTDRLETARHGNGPSAIVHLVTALSATDRHVIVQRETDHQEDQVTGLLGGSSNNGPIVVRGLNVGNGQGVPSAPNPAAENPANGAPVPTFSRAVREAVDFGGTNGNLLIGDRIAERSRRSENAVLHDPLRTARAAPRGSVHPVRVVHDRAFLQTMSDVLSRGHMIDGFSPSQFAGEERQGGRGQDSGVRKDWEGLKLVENRLPRNVAGFQWRSERI